MAFVRHTAKLCTIKEIIAGSFKESEGWDVNCVHTVFGEVHKANLMGLVVHCPDKYSLLLDDGSARVLVQSSTLPERLDVGDVVQIIGRPILRSNDCYISAEIITRLNTVWLELRKAQLLGRIKKDQPTELESEPANEPSEPTESLEEIEEMSSHDKITTLIKELDDGSGADIEELIEKSKLKDAERVLQSMQERGEIFEIKPGLVKVLQ